MHPGSVGFIPEIQGSFNIWKLTNITNHINKQKEKHSTKCNIYLKNLSKLGTEGIILNLIKGI